VDRGRPQGLIAPADYSVSVLAPPVETLGADGLLGVVEDPPDEDPLDDDPLDDEPLLVPVVPLLLSLPGSVVSSTLSVGAAGADVSAGTDSVLVAVTSSTEAPVTADPASLERPSSGGASA
jgi:hypothetical protein